MKKSVFEVGLVVLLVVLLAGARESRAGGREKTPVGVAAFSDQSGKKLGASATEYVTGTFIKLKYFRVLERSQMDQVVRELERQQSDLMDARTAIDLGKQIGAQITVVGSVSGAGYNVAKKQCTVYDSKGKPKDAVCLEAKATATLSVRMVNVETGEALFSEVMTGSASKTYQPGSQPEPESALIDEALRRAAHDLYRPVQKAFPLVGTVLQKEGQIIWVDLGSEVGIQKGRGMIIYKDKGKEIRNPKTGEVAGYERKEVARDQVSEVMPEMCKMKVGKKEAENIKPGYIVEAKPELWF